jgi:hypothetical protein
MTLKKTSKIMNEVMLINGSVFIHPGDTDIYICIFYLKLGDILTNDIFISVNDKTKMIASIMENVTIRAHNMQVAVAPNEQ